MEQVVFDILGSELTQFSFNQEGWFGGRLLCLDCGVMGLVNPSLSGHPYNGCDVSRSLDVALQMGLIPIQ
jgi:hypothetical protein